MGIPAFWASPFPDLSDTGRSPSHITLVIWFRVTGDTHITRFLGMGLPISLLHPSLKNRRIRRLTGEMIFSIIHYIFTVPIKNLLYPYKFCISIAFNFPWDDCNTPEELEQWLCKILEDKQGVLWAK